MTGAPSSELAAWFWTIYLATPLIVGGMLGYTGILRRGLTMSLVITGYYWLVAFFGYGLLFTGWSEYRAMMGVVDPYLIAQCMLFSATTLILMTIGVAGAWRLAENTEHRPMSEQKPLNRRQKGVLAATLLFVASMIVLYLRSVPEVALLVLLRHNGDPAVARSLMTNAFSGPIPFHYFQLALQSVASFCLYVLIAHALLRRRSATWLIVATTTMSVLIVNALDLQKAPIVWISAGIVLTLIFSLPPRRQLQMAVIGSSPVLLLALGAVATVAGVSDHSPAEITRVLFDRMLVGGITPAYFYLDAVPTAVPFLDGSTFPNPRGLLPWEPFPYTQFFHAYMNPLMHDRGITGSAPTAYWAELYVNFGSAALLIFPPVVGFLLGLVDRAVSHLAPAPLRPALLAWLTLHFMKLAETGISRYLFDEKLLVTIALGFVLARLRRVDDVDRQSEAQHSISAATNSQCLS